MTLIKSAIHYFHIPGMINVLKRKYKTTDRTSFANLEHLINYFVSDVLPTIEDLSPNYLTLPFLFDLVLKNDKISES